LSGYTTPTATVQTVTGVPISGMPLSPFKGSLLLPAIDTTQPLNMQNVSIAASGLMLGTGFVQNTYTTNIAATGFYQQDAVLLVSQVNAVTSVSASGGVMLPTVQPGVSIRVFHEDYITGNTLAVYPPLGQTLGDLGTNYPSGMIYGQGNDFNYMGSNTWYVR